jgi:hypothetical protein
MLDPQPSFLIHFLSPIISIPRELCLELFFCSEQAIVYYFQACFEILTQLRSCRGTTSLREISYLIPNLINFKSFHIFVFNLVLDPLFVFPESG